MVMQLHTNQKNIMATQIHSHFIHSSLAGNFLCPVHFPKASGGEWVPTHPSSPPEPILVPILVGSTGWSLVH